MSARDRDDDPARRKQKVPADVTPNAEQTALLLAELEAKRRQEIESVARRLTSDADFRRAVFAELARADPGRFGSLTQL